MTNKKFKVAAMSMALTACGAAQPLIANAADEVNINSNEPASQSEEGSSTVADTSTSNGTESNGSESNGTESNGTGNESNPSDGTNMESTETKEEAFGEHVDVEYNHGQSTTDKETGSTTTPGKVVKNDGTGNQDKTDGDQKNDETGDQGKTDGDQKNDETGDQGKTDGDQKNDETGGEKKPNELVPPTDGGNTEKDKKDEDKQIGNATIVETPNGTVTGAPVPKPGAKPETKTDTTTKDGTTTITETTTLDATQTTTTTGSGHAKADTKETIIDTKEINPDFLEKELGDINWNVNENDTVGTDKENPYKVISKEEKPDGNTTKQTLTLEKVEESSGHMTAEDIAKLVDADRDSVNKQEDGSYTLKRTETVTDADGNPVTRTTYITVRKDTDEVSIKTTTTIKVTREKVEHHKEDDKDAFEKDTATGFKLPDIALYDKETNKQVDSIDETKLNELIHNENTHENTQTKPDGTKKTIYTVTVKEGDVTREYEITKDLDSRKLTAGEIAARMGNNYEAKGEDVFYKDANGKEWMLTVDQTNVIREKLSYTVKVKETQKDPNGPTIDNEKKAAAEAEAKDEAVRSALTKAVTKMLEEHTITENEAKELNKKISDGTINAEDGGTFQTDITVDGVTKHFTLDYSKGTITSTSETPRKDKDDDKTTDNKDLTANGSSYVTSGTVSWTDSKTGEGKHSNFEGENFTAPDDKYLTGSTNLDGKVEKIYTVVSEDGKTTRIYKVIEEDIQLSDLGENEKKDLAWKQLEKETKKSRETLEKEGYKVTDVTFNGNIKKVSWNITETVTTTTTTTDKKEKDLSDIIYVDGGQKWTIDEKAGTITIGNDVYKNVKKNNDGSYTCDVIDPNNNQKTSYTFTETNSSTLTDDQIKEMLVGQLTDDFHGITAKDINLSTDGKTAFYTKDGKTVTIDYSKLGKELKVTKDVHHSNSTTVTTKDGENADAKFKEACEKLLEDIKTEILPKLDKNKGEELWIGNTHVTEDTTLTTAIMEYFTKAISSADMSNDEIIKALEEQARVAKETDVKVNEGKTDRWGNDLEETLKNYYDGEKEGTYYVKPDGSTYLDYVNWFFGKPYYYDQDKGWVELTQKTGQKDKYISHLDLASDSKLDLLPDEEDHVETTDCVLIGKDLKLEWNYKADDLVKDKNNTTVSLEDEITFDSEDGKKGSGHYEYNRGSNYKNTLPTKSAYYKLTGTVVYDAVTDSDGNVTKYGSRKAARKAYCDETGRAYDTVSEEDFAKYVVKVGDKYQVYTKSSQLEAYGYMTRDANTCVNKTYRNQHDKNDKKPFDYIGGYDLMISKLVQVREGKIVGQTKSNTKTITAPWSIRTTEKKTDDWLQLTKKTTEITTPTTTTTDPKEVGKGSNSTTTGNFKYNYTHDQGDTFDWTEGGTTSGVNGTGDGDYTSFVRWVSRVFNGASGEHTKKGGTFHYKYDYTTVGDLQGEHLTQTVEKHAKVDYDYITEEVRNVKITDQEVTIITPDDGDDDDGGSDDGDEIIDEKDSDSPVLPGTPELPPVQDAKPDAPVLPADPALPAVQDAHALPQTGVNWLAAIGLALSGMTLMITGAFASLLGKNAKH